MKLTAIKLHRQRAGLLQIETAIQAQIARARLSEIENGHLRARPDEIERLAKVLGVEPGALIEATVGVQS